MRPELKDYLEIDAAEATRQWRAILARQPVAKGDRQESYRPIEVVLCFQLFRVLDPRSFGGANIHKLPEPAMCLAAAFRRTPGSVLSKMLNLSFEREHGGRLEPEVFLRLSNDRSQAFALYSTILAAARGVGLDASVLPDFVGMWDGPILLGQDELGTNEIGQAVEEVRDEAATTKLREWFGESQTERIVESRIRLGQHRFATQVLDAFDHHCGFCGFSSEGLQSRGLLIASHVKPWAKCQNDRERLDPRNGIAACPTHDRAFDSGLLTVNGGLRIHRSRDLEVRLADRVTDSFFGPQVVHDRLLVGRSGQGPAPKYLEYHKTHVFGRGA